MRTFSYHIHFSFQYSFQKAPKLAEEFIARLRQFYQYVHIAVIICISGAVGTKDTRCFVFVALL